MNDSQIATVAKEVLANLPETIVQVDDQRRIAHVNRPESPVFSRRVEVGDGIADVVVPEATEAIIGMITNAEQTGGALAEYRSDGDLYRVTAKPLASAPVTLLIFKNITGIRSAGQTIVDLVRDRSSFIAAVSHELRTPLTAVVGYANLLADDSELDDETRAAMVRHMADQAWDLAGIVEDLLTVASAELGELHMASVGVNVSANVAQVIESMGWRGEPVDVVVQGGKNVVGVGDPARYRQVVRNLLSNALRHGAEPVSTVITEEDGEAVLLVKDNGDGISHEIEELIGSDAGNGKSPPPGQLGLGLWISQEMTRLMGGNLRYERADGETVFRVAIPTP
ncbi:MAG: HAMP domain-containing sensor histidine kinase [Acidimicrobiia bacterium]